MLVNILFVSLILSAILCDETFCVDEKIVQSGVKQSH